MLPNPLKADGILLKADSLKFFARSTQTTMGKMDKSELRWFTSAQCHRNKAEKSGVEESGL